MSVSDRRESLPARDARLIEETRETIRRSHELLADSHARVRVPLMPQPQSHSGPREGNGSPVLQGCDIAGHGI
jgi:hypothetical protein